MPKVPFGYQGYGFVLKRRLRPTGHTWTGIRLRNFNMQFIRRQASLKDNVLQGFSEE